MKATSKVQVTIAVESGIRKIVKTTHCGIHVNGCIVAPAVIALTPHTPP